MRKLKDAKVNTVHAGGKTRTSQRQASQTEPAAVAPRLLLRQPGQLGVQCQARAGVCVTAISNDNLRAAELRPQNERVWRKCSSWQDKCDRTVCVFFLIMW